jgi:hypothetical protein
MPLLFLVAGWAVLATGLLPNPIDGEILWEDQLLPQEDATEVHNSPVLLKNEVYANSDNEYSRSIDAAFAANLEDQAIVTAPEEQTAGTMVTAAPTGTVPAAYAAQIIDLVAEEQEIVTAPEEQAVVAKPEEQATVEQEIVVALEEEEIVAAPEEQATVRSPEEIVEMITAPEEQERVAALEAAANEEQAAVGHLHSTSSMAQEDDNEEDNWVMGTATPTEFPTQIVVTIINGERVEVSSGSAEVDRGSVEADTAADEDESGVWVNLGSKPESWADPDSWTGALRTYMTSDDVVKPDDLLLPDDDWMRKDAGRKDAGRNDEVLSVVDEENDAAAVVNDACGEGFERMKCDNYGDPHFTTFSGLKHSAMGQGEYILAQNVARTFSVHACHQPLEDLPDGASVSQNTGVVIKSQWGVLKYNDPTGAKRPEIPEGSGITFQEHTPAFGINTIVFPSGEMVLTKNDGEVTTIELPSAYCDNVYGLCGAYKLDDNFANTLAMNDFNEAGEATVWDGEYEERWNNGPVGGTFQTEFVESWKVTSAEALFSASECPSGESSEGVPAADYAECPELEAEAEAKCPTGVMHEDCVADVGQTCELEKWVEEATEAEEEFESEPEMPATVDDYTGDAGDTTDIVPGGPTLAPSECVLCDNLRDGLANRTGLDSDEAVEITSKDSDIRVVTAGPTAYGGSILVTAMPTMVPSVPTEAPTDEPTAVPTSKPTEEGFHYFNNTEEKPCYPTENPTKAPTKQTETPTMTPTRLPTEGEAGEEEQDDDWVPGTYAPSKAPSMAEEEEDGWVMGTATPTAFPTYMPPTHTPTATPTRQPSKRKTSPPTGTPTLVPTESPTEAADDDDTFIIVTAKPSRRPTSNAPSAAPAAAPTAVPTAAPTEAPTAVKTVKPTTQPTIEPTAEPTTEATTEATTEPTTEATVEPTVGPTVLPSAAPTLKPTSKSSLVPTPCPTIHPTDSPTTRPTDSPTTTPSRTPTNVPSTYPTPASVLLVTARPTSPPVSQAPTKLPSSVPTVAQTKVPTKKPTIQPTNEPTNTPTTQPTLTPTEGPTTKPTNEPTMQPTNEPTKLIIVPTPLLVVTARPTNLPVPAPAAEGEKCSKDDGRLFACSTVGQCTIDDACLMTCSAW